MRISMREFVPGSWSVPQNPITGGMGDLAALADFVNAKFTVPQNPVLDAQRRRRGTGDFVNGKFTVPQNPVLDANQSAVAQLAPTVRKCMGDFAPTGPMYPIQENSVLAAYQAQGLAGLGCGCGCSGGCGGCSKGMGAISAELTQLESDISAGNWSQAIGADTLFSVPVWVYVAAVPILYFAVFSGGEHSRYSRGRRAARAAAGAYS